MTYFGSKPIDFQKMPVDLPGLDEKLRQDIEERIEEFERKHLADVLNGGDGWVPRVRTIDYIISVGINLVPIIWLIIAYTRV